MSRWTYQLTLEEEKLCAEIGWERQKPMLGQPERNINYSEGDVWETLQHMICVGQTGTGKSIVINEKLAKGLNDDFLTLMMAFSASTSVNQTQDIIDSKLD